MGATGDGLHRTGHVRGVARPRLSDLRDLTKLGTGSVGGTEERNARVRVRRDSWLLLAPSVGEAGPRICASSRGSFRGATPANRPSAGQDLAGGRSGGSRTGGLSRVAFWSEAAGSATLRGESVATPCPCPRPGQGRALTCLAISCERHLRPLHLTVTAVTQPTPICTRLRVTLYFQPIYLIPVHRLRIVDKAWDPFASWLRA